MKFFKVDLVDERGRHTVENLAAEHAEDLYSVVKDRGLYLAGVTEVTRLGGNRIPTIDLIIFCRQLSTMIEAGVSILKAITIIENSTRNLKVKKLYGNLTQEIQRGHALSVAMRKQGTAFPEILINMVAAGEAGGTLEKSLGLMSVHFDKEQHLKNKVRSASTYPIILAVVSVAVVILLVTFVLPNITGMFDPAKLPPLTKFVMGFSHILTSYGHFIAMGIGGLVGLLIYLLRIPAFKLKWDFMKLRLPILGKLNKVIYSARAARSFASLYLSGIQTLPMLEMSARILNNTYIEEQFQEVILRVSQGEIISTAMADTGIFDPMLSSMINVGEETGSLGDILVKTADYFDGEADTALQKMVSMVEPLMLILMGGAIGVIVVAVIQPIFQMYEAVGG